DSRSCDTPKPPSRAGLVAG
ncbi:rCG33413, partial [Rattus norvegicus]